MSTEQWKFDPLEATELAILLVEDNEVNQLVAREMLRRFGQDPDIVDNGKKAVERMREQTYDLVLMDIHMPVMDGREATRIIRQEHGHVPFIVAMTASVLEEDRRQCIEAGMDRVTVKPVRPPELREVVSGAMERRRRRLRDATEKRHSTMPPPATSHHS